MHQPRSRIFAAFFVQPAYTQLSALVFIQQIITLRLPIPMSLPTHYCHSFYNKCACSSYRFWLSFIGIISQTRLGAICLMLIWLPSCMKFLLTVRMQPVANTLNYSIIKYTEQRTPDIYVCISHEPTLASHTFEGLSLHQLDRLINCAMKLQGGTTLENALDNKN